MTDTLARLSAVSRALRLRELQKIRPLLDEETRLRRDIKRLGDMESTTLAADAFDPTMKALGADLLWRSWISQSNRQLNLELARLLAKKYSALERLKPAVGKEQAVSALYERDKIRRRRQATTGSTARLLELLLLESGGGGND